MDDLLLGLFYIFINPFQVSKRYLVRRGEKDFHVYGETPLTSFARIAKACKISASDRVLDLGCGRGRLCFWLSSFFKCEVTGIERISLFTFFASFVAKIRGRRALKFFKKDIFAIDLSPFSVIYIYGSNFSNEQITLLIEKLQQVCPACRIITVSYSLSLYRPDAFKTLMAVPIAFPWGKTVAYIQQRVGV